MPRQACLSGLWLDGNQSRGCDCASTCADNTVILLVKTDRRACLATSRASSHLRMIKGRRESFGRDVGSLRPGPSITRQGRRGHGVSRAPYLTGIRGREYNVGARATEVGEERIPRSPLAATGYLVARPAPRPGCIWDRLKGAFRPANDNVSCFCMRRGGRRVEWMGSAMGPDGVGKGSTGSLPDVERGPGSID
jgi:hypothetical protein